MNHELYRRLGLDPDASSNQIKIAYRTMVKTCHPDTWPGDEAKAEQFRLLTEAYEILSDPKKKAEYDESGDIRTSLDMDDPRIQALTKLGELFINAIESIEDVDREDPLKAAVLKAQQSKNRLKKTLREVEDEQKKMKVVRQRLKRAEDSDDNALFRTLDHRDRLLSDAVRDINEEIESYTMVIEIARNYKYETMLAIAGFGGEPRRRRMPVHETRGFARGFDRPDIFDEDLEDDA